MVNGRNKGANAEREFIKILQTIVDSVMGPGEVELKRNLEQVRVGGYDVVGLPWMALEIKRCETLNIKAWWEQCLRQCKKGQVPILAYRQNNKPWRVRLAGYVFVSNESPFVETVIELSQEGFMAWFREKVKAELRGQVERMSEKVGRDDQLGLF